MGEGGRGVEVGKAALGGGGVDMELFSRVESLALLSPRVSVNDWNLFFLFFRLVLVELEVTCDNCSPSLLDILS